MEKNNLVTPSTTLIEKYWTIYNKSDHGDPDDYTLPLFEGTKPVNLLKAHYLTQKNFSHAECDREIRNYLLNGDINRFLRYLNAGYSTRVRNLDKLIDDRNWWYCRNARILPAYEDLDDFIRYCHDDLGMGCYPYSFASKIYSFLCPETYPILDSISVTLLNEYLKEPEGKGPMPKCRWHCYQNYKDDYDKFRTKYGLSEDLTYKQIDVFLWTYGTVLDEYWKQMGVLPFKGIEYSPPKE